VVRASLRACVCAEMTQSCEACCWSVGAAVGGSGAQTASDRQANAKEPVSVQPSFVISIKTVFALHI
jgi:hypothetical protein